MQSNGRILFLLCFLTGFLEAADPLAEIISFSEFKEIDLKKLMGGKILAERGSVMDFPRGISLQTCFVVACPVKVAAELLPFWDQTPHAKLGVYQNVCFQQVDEKTFEKFTLDPGKRPMKRLIDRTLEANPEKTDLQMSFDEFALLQSCLNTPGPSGGKDQSVESVQRFWGKLLMNRWQQFEKGGIDALSPYDVSRSKFSAGSEIRSVLAEEPKITKRFESLLSETLSKSQGAPSAKPVTCYWVLSDVNRTANPSLGVVYSKEFPDHWQLVDMTFYTSGDYFASMIFYELWPVKVENREQTLIWRFDGVSAPSLAFTKGVDRMVAGGIMLQELKKVVEAFQEDAAKPGAVKQH